MYSCYSCSAMYSTLVSNAQNPPKISSLKNVLTTFYSKFKKIYIMRIVLKFKMCFISYKHKYDRSISRIFEANFWRIFCNLVPVGALVCFSAAVHVAPHAS